MIFASMTSLILDMEVATGFEHLAALGAVYAGVTRLAGCYRVIRSRAGKRLMLRKATGVCRNCRRQLRKLTKKPEKRHANNHRSESSDELRPQPSRTGAVLDILHSRGRQECGLGFEVCESITITVVQHNDAPGVSKV